MNLIWMENFYAQHEALCNAAMLAAVFGGMARIAFWRDHDGLRVGGLLAVGLAALLTVAALKWATREGRTITEFGPLAALILCEAILLLGWRAFTNSSKS